MIVDNADGTSHTSPTCIVPAVRFNGTSIRTVEGHAKNGELTILQKTFIEHFAFQCGYCTAGFLNEGQVLLERLAWRSFVAFLRAIGEQEIADHRADIEAHRAHEGEFRIYDAGFVSGANDRTGMQIAVDERLRGGEKLILAGLLCDFERRIGLEGALVGVVRRTGPAVERCLAVGIGGDEVLGDAAELDVAREKLESMLMRGRRSREHRSVKQCCGEKLGDIGGKVRIFYTAD